MYMTRRNLRTTSDSSVRRAGLPGALTSIHLGLAHPLADRLRTPDPQEFSDPAHRCPLSACLGP